MRKTRMITAGLLFTALAGCGAQVNSIDRSTVRLAETSEKMSADLKTMTTEIQQDRELIQAITDSMKTLASSMEELASIAKVFKSFITDRETKKEAPAATPDIGDVLK